MFNEKTQRPMATITFSDGSKRESEIQILGNNKTMIIPIGQFKGEIESISNGWEFVDCSLYRKPGWAVVYLEKKH